MSSSYCRIVGVDIASRKFDVYDNCTSKHRVIENSAAAVNNFVKLLSKSKRKTLVVMEATGGYENALVDALHEADIDVAVSNPLQIRSFARGCGMIEKNDAIDAKMIAKFGEVVEPKIRKKPSENQRKLKALVHRREQILSQMLAEQNRKKQTTDESIISLIAESIAFYQRQLKAIDAEIAKTVHADEATSHKATVMLSCPGVGIATTSMLLAELPEIGTISRGQIAKLVGVAPLAKDSGLKEGKRSTYAGRSMVRNVLYMAALVSTKHNPVMQAFYERLLSKGKPKKLALVAVMRKLLTTLNVMVREQKTWREPTLAKP
jgi:transposase